MIAKEQRLREEGIEPPTAGTGIQRSTTELFPRQQSTSTLLPHALSNQTQKHTPYHSLQQLSAAFSQQALLSTNHLEARTKCWVGATARTCTFERGGLEDKPIRQDRSPVKEEVVVSVGVFETRWSCVVVVVGSVDGM